MTDPSPTDPFGGSDPSEAGQTDPVPDAADGAGSAGSAESADPAAQGTEGDGAVDGGDGASVEQLIADLEAATAERDEARAEVLRVRADFENSRKRVVRQAAEDAERAAADVAEELLTVLDVCDSAAHHGSAEVEPIYAALLGALEKKGLERIDPAGEEFDPNRHEAVMHEPAADGDEGTVVSDVMRPGYAWKGRVLRPAMVKVRG